MFLNKLPINHRWATVGHRWPLVIFFWVAHLSSSNALDHCRSKQSPWQTSYSTWWARSQQEVGWGVWAIPHDANQRIPPIYGPWIRSSEIVSRLAILWFCDYHWTRNQNWLIKLYGISGNLCCPFFLQDPCPKPQIKVSCKACCESMPVPIWGGAGVSRFKFSLFGSLNDHSSKPRAALKLRIGPNWSLQRAWTF